MKLIDLLHLLDTLYDREEFHMLCFALDVDSDRFETRGKDNQLRELLTLLRRRKRLLELIEIVSRERPQGHADWDSVRQAVLLIQEQSQADAAMSDVQGSPPGSQPTQGLLGSQLGNYQLVEKLGEGGMAEVYKGYRADLDQFAAVKVMHSFLAAQETAVARFRREAKVLSSLDHPHIIRLFEFQPYAANAYYLVMEYIQGPTLKNYLEQMMPSGKPLALTETVNVILQIADALAYAHQQGIIHRDIKPANIMLTEQGRAVLTDFGIVKLLGGQASSVYTATGAMLGTPAYLPPEQALGGEGDARADIYSLGILLFYMATGHLPFVADAPMAVIMKHISEPVPLPESYNPTIPLRLRQVILKALEKDPNGRYPTMTAMIEALRLVNLGGQVVPDFASFTQLPAVIPSGDWTDPADWREDAVPPPFHVPPPIPYFAGRGRTVEALVAQLTSSESNTIVGLVGFGGVGKTAVAIQTARQLQDSFPDGILWAQLDSSTIEADLASFAQAYGQAEALAKLPDLATKAEFVRSILADKRVLVVLDQVTDSEQVKWLLPTGPKNKTLITTRNGKLLTNLNANILPLRAMSADEGLSLLSEMVGAQRVTADLAAARQLIHNTGGIPLALSIAAGFLNEAPDLTLNEYADLLQNEQERLEHLTDWSDTTRDVSASFELSYQSLPTPLQTLFAALSVFDGPDFDSHAVAAVLKMPVAQVKLGLGRLFFLSLVSGGLGEREQLFPIEADGNGRYRLNPLLKLFARKKLGDSYPALREAVNNYYIRFAQEHPLPEAYDSLALEWPHIYQALTWSVAQNDGQSLVQGILALTHLHLSKLGFLDVRGYWREAYQLLHACQPYMAALDEATQAALWHHLGGFALRLSDMSEAQNYLQQAYDLLQAQPHTALRQAYVAAMLARAWQQNDRATALAWVQRSQTILHALADNNTPLDQGAIYVELGGIVGPLGLIDEAESYNQRGLALLPETPPLSVRVTGLMNLGIINQFHGQYEQCVAYYETAIPLARSLKDPRLLARLYINLTGVQELQGQYEAGLTSIQEAEILLRFMGAIDEQIRLYNMEGLIHHRLGQDDQAQQVLEKSIQLAKQKQVEEPEIFARINLGAVTLALGQLENCQTHLQRAEAIGQELAMAYLLPEIRRLQARLALAHQDVAAAQSLIDQSLRTAREGGDKKEEGISWRVQGDILLSQAKLPEALAAYQTSLTRLQRFSPYEQALTRLALAGCYTQMQQIAAAKDNLEVALQTFIQLQTVREIQQARSLVAQIEQMFGSF